MAGQWHEHEIEPLDLQQNDLLLDDGTTLSLIRGGVVVATRALGTGSPITPGVSPDERQLTHLFRWRVNLMASGVTATLTDVVVNETTGEIDFHFSDGETRNYANRAAALAAVGTIDTNPDTPKDYLIAYTLRHDDGGANMQVAKGRCCVLDFAAADPLTLSAGAQV